MAPKNAGIYCRLSYAPDGSLEKVERQEADCRKLAEQLGWSVAKVYPDNSRSAWKRNRKRPQWEQMLTDIEAGKLDGILVYHGDRLIRQPWDLELLLKLADDRHFPMASPQGTKDLNSEDDRFILRIEVAQACKASADTSRRVRRANEARAKEGRPTGGGNRPFGFGIATGELGVTGKPLYDLEQQVPEEAEIGREAVTRLLAGQSQGGVIAWLNTVCTTTNGNKWTPSGFRQWLVSPRIAGLVEYKPHKDAPVELYEGTWEPIVSQEDWEDVKALLKRKTELYPSHGRERIHLLSGDARCGSCDGPLWTKPITGRSAKSRQYYCSNPDCPNRVSRNIRHLDEYVIGRVLRRLNEPAFIEAVYAESEQPGMGAEIASLERRKAVAKGQLDELADHPDVDPAWLVRSLVSFDRKIEQLRGQLQETSSRRLLARMAGITREQWDAEPIDVRAETVRTLFKVTVLPVLKRGPGFDQTRVKVERRV
jgi:DNA invertase Pin-like site-specific DNA recombinase